MAQGLAGPLFPDAAARCAAADLAARAARQLA
jgi:hypothetical protein